MERVGVRSKDVPARNESPGSLFGASYQVDRGPTGMPWIGAMNWDMSWVGVPIHWIRYLRRHPRTWSVSVAEIQKRSIGVELVHEEFAAYREASDRFRGITRQIESRDLARDEMPK